MLINLLEWQTVTNPEAIRLMLEADVRKVLTPLMLSSNTVKGIAEQLELPLNAVHHKVKLLERAGLLAVCKIEARRGRPTKHYQATARGFFVPFVETSNVSVTEFARQQIAAPLMAFVDLVASAGSSVVEDINQAGLRFYVDGDFVEMDLTPAGSGFDLEQFLQPDAPALMHYLTPLWLTRAHAKELQREMIQLIEKYQGQRGTAIYMAHVGLAPDVEPAPNAP
jgi:hypothetical protein